MSALIDVTVDGVRWRVAPDCVPQLFGPNGLRLPEWLQGGQAAVVKQGPHRVVYRVELPGLHFYLKHNRIPDRRSWLRQLVQPSKASREYERAMTVRARGVPTAVPLAVGAPCNPLGRRGSYLVTRSLEGVGPLNEFLATDLLQRTGRAQAGLRQRLAVALGQFIAGVHEAGVLHKDLHCGNVLVRLNEEGQPQFFLIDLQTVQFGKALSWRSSRANLVIFNRWFTLHASRSDRLRFWHAYRQARPAIGGRLAVLARELEVQTRASTEAFWRWRDRRCLGVNRHYRHVRTGSMVGHAVTGLDRVELAALMADPDAPFRHPDVPLLKNGRSSTVGELQLTVDGQTRPVIYKRFRVTGWRGPLLSRLRCPPALRSWVFGHGLGDRGLPTARPLAVLHRRRLGLYHEAYFLMDKIPGAVELRHFVAGLAGAAATDRRRQLRPLIDPLARMIRDMHVRHLSHRDLKAANVLVQPAAGQRPPALWLIDLVGLAHHRKVPRRLRVKNLGRLNASFHASGAVTRTDRLRFLRVYLQWGLFGRQGWKRWWRQIEAATQAKIAQNARRGRHLA